MSLTCPDGRLVHTPPANIREGLLGYVLRVSEANGYDTPWHIFSSAGIGQGGMAVSTLPIDKLARVLGRPHIELTCLPWQKYPNGAAVPPLNRGRPSLLRHLQLQHPKICPDCIAENGMLDAAWDLRIMHACPKHGTPLVDHCPACREKLTWFRPGLAHCRCGHHFSAQEGSVLPQHTLDLLQVIYDTLHGLPTNSSPTSGIPANALHQLGIDDLLRLLTKLDHTISGDKQKGKYAGYELDRLVCMAGIFADWPTQFHLFLRTIDPSPELATSGLARRFGNFYDNIVAAKWTTKEKMQFFRTAFGQYGSYDGVTPGADPRFFLTPAKWRKERQQGLSASQVRMKIGTACSPSDIVNQTELARRLGVRPVTARRWASQGLFGLTHHGVLASGQVVYKTPDSLPRKITDGTMNVRGAAKYLGIPVSMLVRLRRDGYYRTDHVGTYLTQFNTQDLNRLRTLILTRAPKTLLATPADHVTLKEFFRMKLHGVEVKYQVIRNILDGDLPLAGCVGENIEDLVISSKWIKAYRNDTSVHESIPLLSAAKILECDASVCTALVAQGRLQGFNRGRNLYVTIKSIEAFGAKYISCIGIAKQSGLGFRHVRQVRRVLSEQGVDLLRVQQTRRPKNAEQIFCAREQAAHIFFESCSENSAKRESEILGTTHD